MKKFVFLNGKFIPENEAMISAQSPGLLCGWGLFETMRYYNERIVYLTRHLERLKASSELIDISLNFSSAQLKRVIGQIVKINCLGDANVRLTLWKSESGTDILISAKKYNPYHLKKYKQGFSACVSSFRQNEHYFLAAAKLTNRVFFQLAHLEAKRKGLDEAIILNNRGNLAEASRSNIFLIKDNQLFTPGLESGCLDGITRKAVFDLAKKNNIEIQELNLTLYDLYSADEAFLTNSLIGVMPLVSAGGKCIAGGKPGSVTKFFMEEYDELL